MLSVSVQGARSSAPIPDSIYECIAERTRPGRDVPPRVPALARSGERALAASSRGELAPDEAEELIKVAWPFASIPGECRGDVLPVATQ